MMERLIKDNMTPRECLELILCNVDYTIGNCRFADMVGAVLSKQIIDVCKKSLVQRVNHIKLKIENDKMEDYEKLREPLVNMLMDFYYGDEHSFEGLPQAKDKAHDYVTWFFKKHLNKLNS